MKHLLFGGARLDSVTGDLGLLILRVFAGFSLALAHGLSKLPPPEIFVRSVETLGMPAPMAWLSAFAEVVGALALAAGFATRLMALMLVVNFSVAGFLQHASDPYQVKELAFLFLAVSLMFALVGAGRFSVDRAIQK